MSPTTRKYPDRSRARPGTWLVALLAAVLTLGLTWSPSATAQEEELFLRYDFGTTSSPVEDGYTRVANNELFDEERGYGLSQEVNSRSRGGPDALRRDFIVGTTSFLQNLADGDYWVTVISGDDIAANYTTLAVNGNDQGLLQSPAGEFSTWSGPVAVTNGQLDIAVGRDGRLNAVTISNVFPPTDVAAVVTAVDPHPVIDVTWSAAPMAVDYAVTRIDPDGTHVGLGSTDTTAWQDESPELELAATYTYYVQQRTSLGTLSNPSDEVAVTVELAGVEAPETPADLEITPIGEGDRSLLSWTGSESAISYLVERTDHEPRGYDAFLVTDATEIELDHGPDGDSYFRWYYRVTAIGAGGSSEPSASVEQSRQIESHLVSEIDTSAAGPGARPLVGDVNGDGRADIVMMQPHHINAGALRDGPMVAALTAYEITGEQIWQIGEMDPQGRNNTQDIPAQVHDIDNDGFSEVIAVMYPDGDTTREGRFYVFDGLTGAEKWSFDLPDPLAHDSIIFVDASGQGFAGEILLKTRYTKAWLLTADGEVLWEHEGNTGQYPWPYDFDGDGREEIMIGYDMVSPDGELLWRVDLPDHADTIWVADIDEDGVADVLLGGASTSAHRWDTGEQIWINQDTVESQNILVGKLRDDVPGLQVFGLDRINRTSNGLDGLFMLDREGTMIWQEERQTRGCYGSIPEIVHNWAGDGRDQMMVWQRGCGEPAGVFSGDGEFMTELSDVRMHHADVCGDGRDEIIEYLQGQWVRIVSSTQDCAVDAKITREPRPQGKREYNYTRYTAGQTPVAPVQDAPLVSIEPSTVTPGASVTITATGYGYEPVEATLTDSGAVIGSGMPVAGRFEFSWTVPADTPDGDISVTVASAFASAEAALTVSAPVDPSPEPTVDPSPEPTETVTPPPTFEQPGDLYSTPGFHDVNGRQWHTDCEPYSQTIRCTTEIWATQVTIEGGQFVSTTGWHFNNLTYLPFMTRTAWGTNPLANTGEWTSTEGRQWKTECDTPATGGNGCRSWIWADYVSSQNNNGTWTHQQDAGWVVNNIVRFR